MKKKVLFIVLMVTGAMFSSHAFAFFANEETPLPVPRPAFDLSGNTNIVTQVGVGVPTDVSGFGDDLPLEDSIDMVLPEHWSFVSADDFEFNDRKATWKTQGSWVEALETIGKQNDLRFLVDWENNKVVLTTGNPENPLNMQEQVEAQLMAEVEKEVECECIEPEKLPVWEIGEGSLKDQLSDWADIAEWQLVWAAKTDYRISAEAQIEGSFTGAATKVINSMRENGAALRAYIYKGNNVLLVKGE